MAVAVLSSGSVDRPAAKATGAVNTSELPTPAAICAPVAPNAFWPVVPVTAPQLAAPMAAQVALAVRVTPAGSGSLMVTLVASDTPPCVRVTV